MFWLGLTISISLLVAIGLPIGLGFWLNRKFGVPWRIVTYGAMGYLVLQSVISLILGGVDSLVVNGTLVLTETALNAVQLSLNILLSAVLGVALRWAIMKFMPDKPDSLEAAYGIGIGYGGAESVLIVGLPLLITFVNMLTNLDFRSASTGLDPEIVSQLEALWNVSVLIPLASAVERITAFVMHLTVTVFVFHFFLTHKKPCLLAAAGIELVVNGLVVGLSTLGLAYGWIILVSVLLMLGNLYLLYKMKAFSLKYDEVKPEVRE